jgi:hypothetical protein
MYCTFHRHDGVLIVELDLVQGNHSIEPLDLDTSKRLVVEKSYFVLLRAENGGVLTCRATIEAPPLRRPGACPE